MRSFKELLDPRLLHRLEQRETLTRTMREVLPTEMAKHCWAGNIVDNRLQVLVDDNAWVVRLRYQQREIFAHLNKRYNLELKHIDIKLIPPSPITQSKAINTEYKKPGQEVGQLLLSAARTMSDPEIARVLERMGKKFNKNES